MNSEINKKTPAFIYAKEFKLSKVLGNLQAYKLATGDVGQTEQEEASRKHGNNLGALYGNLITKASLKTEQTEEKDDESGQTSRKRKRRKQQGKQKKKRDSKGQYPVPNVVFNNLNEPLPLPECLQKDEDDSNNSSKEEISESSDDETVDFFGLTSGKDDESSSDDSNPKSDTEISTTRNMPNRSFHRESSSESAGICGTSPHPALTTYSCARCNRRGHLTEHCTMPTTETGNHNQVTVKNVSQRNNDVQDLFLQCRKLKQSKNVSCHDCGNTSNLAFCFECGQTLCDGRGHLIDHLLNFPTHTKLYSHKLQKLLKCCNSSCNVVNISDLLVCPQCLSKIFDKQYSLVNATWSNRGLKAIANVLSCDEHFHWHRMNCYDTSEELLFSRENLLKLQQERNGLLSEFFF